MKTHLKTHYKGMNGMKGISDKEIKSIKIEKVSVNKPLTIKGIIQENTKLMDSNENNISDKISKTIVTTNESKIKLPTKAASIKDIIKRLLPINNNTIDNDLSSLSGNEYKTDPDYVLSDESRMYSSSNNSDMDRYERKRKSKKRKRKKAKPRPLKYNYKPSLVDGRYYCVREGCNKSYKQKCSLVQHLNIHNNIKPYKCLKCDKEYYHSKSLTIHNRIHTGL